MRFAVLVLAGISLSSANSHAEDYETASAACVRLAANPQEPGFEGQGANMGQIDEVAAIPACKAAASSVGATGYDHYHLSRAYLEAGLASEYARELQVSAEAGYAFAQEQLGREYIDGKFPQNYVVGRYWLAKAADQGDSYGMVALGYMEWNGLGGPLDREAAIRHEKQAADLGNEDGAANFASYSAQLANAQDPVDANGQTHDEAVSEVQRAEEEQREEVERQNCQFNRAFGDAAAAWAGC